MRALGHMLRHLLAFFVDDGSLAVMTLAWLALLWIAMAQLKLPARWSALLLFAGLAIILAVNAVRRARAR